MGFSKDILIEDFDPKIWYAICQETRRQEEHIDLIASENYTSPRVMAAQGSLLTNKYAEGYPGKRYYGGCKYVDIVEQLAIERAKELFGAHYANVQPHSGSQANAAAYMALLKPGDTVLGMKLDQGGHLTHGSKMNFSGKLYQAFQYGLNTETGRINFDEVMKLTKMHRPKLIVAGFSAYSRTINWQYFREIADEVGAYFMVDMAHVAGLVAAGLYPSPIEIADVVTTTTHKTLRGPRGGLILAKKNSKITEKLNSLVFPGIQGGPFMHVIAAKAVAFKEALAPSFKIYQAQVIANSKYLAKYLQDRNYRIVSHGTDNHLFLINLMDKNISGEQADVALGVSHITVNKNTVPNDLRSPFVTSGLRIGTPAVTTRGFQISEMQQIGNWIVEILNDINNQNKQIQIKKQVLRLCQQFPVYDY